ncbi:MAG: lasso peptide biosynthesis B2 protein [Anaerolineales bacterium]|nr:lasso peptide biosynthesis B2 protein [Anaerolineales bacterium]
MLKLPLGKLKRLRQFTLTEWALSLEAWWALLGFNLLIRFVPFDRIVRVSQNNVDVHPTQSEPGGGKSIYEVIERVSRLHFLKMTCLVRSLTLSWMLSRRSIQSYLKIGARKTLSGLKIHAWIEISGHSLGEERMMLQHFARLTSFIENKT